MVQRMRELGASLPSDHSRQCNSAQLAEEILRARSVDCVLDVGCGNGNSADLFAKWRSGIRWIGVDIESSPEVDSRQRTDLEFHTFDGIKLPFADASFQLVYSNQVLEHVRHPGALLRDIARVLEKGGVLVGSTSHLEPFHSFSYWNYTPYGFKVLAEEAGLEVSQIRPSIDAFTLIFRRLIGRPEWMDRWWWRESPLNAWLSLRARLGRRPHAAVNASKLLFCGQFCFVCTKR